MVARVASVGPSRVEKKSKKKSSRKINDKDKTLSSQKSTEKDSKSHPPKSKDKGPELEIIEIEIPAQEIDITVQEIELPVEKRRAKPSKKSRGNAKSDTRDSTKSPSSSEKKRKRKSSSPAAESVHDSVQSTSASASITKLKEKSSSPAGQPIYNPVENKSQKGSKIPRASDPTPRKILRVQDLDLWKAYEPEPDLEQIIERPEKPNIYYDIGPKPLEDPSKLPEGWTSEELDLDPDDLDAQIHRCEERLLANIMPKVFRNRLKQLKAEKSERGDTLKKYPGVSWDVIQRLESLTRIKAALAEDGDKYEQMANVKALMDAYASQKLVWNKGLVTYWTHGVQLSRPRPFDWDELEAINKKHNGDKSFWVEGVLGPAPSLNMLMTTFGPQAPPLHDFNYVISSCLTLNILPVSKFIDNDKQVQLHIRLPGAAWYQSMEFLHDTGAATMRMFERDINDLQIGNSDPQRVPVLGSLEYRAPTGLITLPLIEVEVTLVDNGVRLFDWVRVATAISDGRVRGRSVPRSDGPVLRQNLYSATAPDGNGRSHFSNSYTDFLDGLPIVSRLHPVNNVPPLGRFHSSFSRPVLLRRSRPGERDSFAPPPADPNAVIPAQVQPMSEAEARTQLAAQARAVQRARDADAQRAREAAVRRTADAAAQATARRPRMRDRFQHRLENMGRIVTLRSPRE
ncbi:hypothetical protein N7478_001885 [Penicillium angulare]|uniref:uncharacterized protein n=1 Tax=Penicillium angulare TaxID=116970 RepID=UPI002541BF31|nr:uncharacterized protein N7478_001885 [Penicillium angulare]KAJ5288855.1 hypothetical protein N7478_001885 [Penicillium angulare]